MDAVGVDSFTVDAVQNFEASSPDHALNWKLEMDLLHEKLDKLIAGQDHIATFMRQTSKVEDLEPSASQGQATAAPRSSQYSASLSQTSITTPPKQDCFHLGKSVTVKLRDFNVSVTPMRASSVPSLNSMINSVTIIPTLRARIAKAERANKLTTKLLDNLPLMPHAPLSLFLDLFSMLLLLYDSIIIPFSLAWDIEGMKFFSNFRWVAVIFWTIDMLLGFARAYTEGGAIVTDSRKVAFHYLQRRFLLDLAIVTMDWMDLIFEMLDGSFAMATPAKAVRIFKIARILRIVSLLKKDTFGSIREFIMHWAHMFGVDMIVSISGKLLKLLLLILYLSHVASCAWVALQASDWKDTATTWERYISQLHNGVSFSDAGLSNIFVYCTAYYWSLSSMFSGSSTLQPMNTAENIFSIGYTLFGVLFSSCMVSAMSAMLIQISERSFAKKSHMQLLSRFLQQRNVDAVTRMLVYRQAWERMRTPARIAEQDVSAISLLSPQLREQLHRIVWNQALMAQPLLRTCAFVDDQVVVDIIRFAVTNLLYDPGHEVFSAGVQIQESFIPLSGSLQYVAEHEAAEDEVLAVHGERSQVDIVKVSVKIHQHVCEIALWAEWTTLGSLATGTICELLSCSATALIENVLPSNPEILTIVRGYAAALLAFIQTDNKMGISDLCSAIDYDTIVALMPQEERVLMSIPSLHALKREAFGNRNKLNKLEQEIVEGACNLGLNEAGLISRTVRLVVLHVQDADGRVCIKLGEWQDREFSVNIALPGTKTMAEETLDDCKTRVLNKYFCDRIPHITFYDTKVDVSMKPSRAYGVPTKYIRTMLYAKFRHLGDHSHRHSTTKVFDWKNEEVICFASVHRDHSSVMSELLAWTNPFVHMDMVQSRHAQRCVATWASGFGVSADIAEVEDVALPIPRNESPSSHREGHRIVVF